ncbi:MAG TPA: hypothetical protein VEK84_00895 [Terriglobales bacterium]|nr:hypothetical protein [Terriglobales bacterium]
MPLLTPVTKALELTVATFVAAEPQEATEVMSWDLPSEYLPSAVSCWVELIGKNMLPGEIVAFTNAAAVTLRVADPLNVDRVAVMFVVP